MAEVTVASAPAPRANPELFGHESAERELLRLHSLGRLPHAILLSGPRGIGKATLAFRLARFLLAKRTANRPTCSAVRRLRGLRSIRTAGCFTVSRPAVTPTS
jgi:DNA polymerase III gamma/tau subunit